MTSRRDFLRKTSLALAGGLILGDAALEAFERLTHRKVWAGADFGGTFDGISRSTWQEWSVHYDSTSAGRFSHAKLKRAIELVRDAPQPRPEPVILSVRQDNIRRRKIFWGMEPLRAAYEAQVS